MDESFLKTKMGTKTYERLEKVVMLVDDHKITKDEFDLAYQGIYKRAMKNSGNDDELISTLGTIYLSVIRHYI